VLPILVVVFSPDQISLMELYAIGVVGAITVNLGSCVFNKSLGLNWRERALMTATALILFAVELTLAKTKPNALFFIVCILLVGLSLRAYALKYEEAKVAAVSDQTVMMFKSAAQKAFSPVSTEASAIMVAARGITPVLRYAVEEAQLRKAPLYVLYVRAVAVNLPSAPTVAEKTRWQDDRQAAEIMYCVLELGHGTGVNVVPLYAVSEDPAATILDLAATLGVDFLMLGASHRRTLVHLLKGNTVTEVASQLPENIQLVIHG